MIEKFNHRFTFSVCTRGGKTPGANLKRKRWIITRKSIKSVILLERLLEKFKKLKVKLLLFYQPRIVTKKAR